MTDQGFTPQVPRQQPVPPVVPPVQAGVPPLTPPPRRGRGVWWIVALVFVALVVGSCGVPLWLIATSEGGLDAGLGDSVAVIDIDGAIAGTGDQYAGYITPAHIRDLLDQAEEDDSVKAIMLRVDSPGGTVAASEEIARYIKACPKPVVVSTGDVNASGAYMVSSQADEIWALPGSSVGSIGVISEIPNVAGLMDKLGIQFTVITAGKHKDTGSPYRALTAEERALIKGQVDEAYGQFIDIVAEGRKMPRAKVKSLATGWAWSGAQAKKLGLVDHLGTYQDALDAAADAGGIKGDYDTVTYDEELPGVISSLLGLSSSMDRISATFGSTQGTSARQVLPR